MPPWNYFFYFTAFIHKNVSRIVEEEKCIWEYEDILQQFIIWIEKLFSSYIFTHGGLFFQNVS